MLLSAIKKSTLLDYPGKLATIVFTPGCNFRCGFCHNPEFVLPERVEKLRSDFISEEVFFRFLKTRVGFLDGVVICGGEPTIHADLPEFCRKIKDLGFLVKLDTNGNRPEVVSHLYEAKLIDFMAMDIKHTPEKYHALAGGTSDPENIRKSIGLIMNSGVSYEFRTTVSKGIHDISDMKGIGAFIR